MPQNAHSVTDRELAQRAMARQDTHEAVCEERYKHLRGDMAGLKDTLDGHIQATADHRHAVRNDLANIQAASAQVVKQAVAEGVASVSSALVVVQTGAEKTDKLVKRLLWSGASLGLVLLAFFIIQTLVLWGLHVQPVG